MRVVVYPADSAGCGTYRLILAAQHLRKQGHDVRIEWPSSRAGLSGGVDGFGNTIQVQAPPGTDVVVMQRLTFRPIAQAVPLLRAQGIAVVVDMDDDLTTIHPANPAYDAYHPKRGDLRHSWENAASACRDATMVTTSAPSLQKIYAPHGRSAVLPNCVPESYLAVERHDNDTIGWGGWVGSHPDDLQTVGMSICRLMREGHRFRVVGPVDGVRSALKLDVEPEATGNVPFETWPHALSTLGIGIAPLADTKFNVSKCLDAETRIGTRRGLLKIREIEPGDEVWHEDRWRRVEATSRVATTMGLKITMRSGRELRLTKEHRLWRADVWASGWASAADLAVGDSLRMTPEPLGVEQVRRAPWPSDGRASRGAHDRQAFIAAEDVPTVAVTERWGRFLGLFAGDGCASGPAVTISCDGIDQDLIDLICADLTAMGLWPATQQSRMWSGDLLRRRSVAASSTHLIRFLRALGVVTQEGVRRIVTVPEIIWRSPKSVVAAYLAGLFEADGSVASTGVTLTTKYHAFAMQIQRLLTAFGIESKVIERWNTAKAGGPKFQSFQLSLRRAAADVFAKEIGFLSARKVAALDAVVTKPHSNAYRPMSWQDEIAAIEDCWLEPVDIQVEGEAFAAAGFVSHNSHLKILEYSALGVPWVASPRVEYARLHKEGAGLLAGKPQQWQVRLRELATNPSLRQELSEAGRALAARYTIETNAWRWLEVWQTAYEMERHAARSGATGLVRA